MLTGFGLLWRFIRRQDRPQADCRSRVLRTLRMANDIANVRALDARGDQRRPRALLKLWCISAEAYLHPWIMPPGAGPSP